MPALLTSTSISAELAHRRPTIRWTSSSSGAVTLDEQIAHAGLLHLVHACTHLLRGLGRLIGLPCR